ncbi:MAG: hypothetical protein QOF48_4026 [Verrucomicrobiota bacterium]
MEHARAFQPGRGGSQLQCNGPVTRPPTGSLRLAMGCRRFNRAIIPGQGGAVAPFSISAERAQPCSGPHPCLRRSACCRMEWGRAAARPRPGEWVLHDSVARESRQRTANRTWSIQATMDGSLNPIEVQPEDWVGFRHPGWSEGCASLMPPLLLPGQAMARIFQTNRNPANPFQVLERTNSNSKD